MASSADFSVVPLSIAQAMKPRPPSPTAAAARQRMLRHENLNLLSARSEASLTKMQSMPSLQKDKTSSPSRADSITGGLVTRDIFPLSLSAKSKAPVRPLRDVRRKAPQPEVCSLIPPFSEFILTSTSSQNRDSSSGQVIIFRIRL